LSQTLKNAPLKPIVTFGGSQMRGYACIGLDNPKTPANVGSAMRAVGVYHAAFLAITGNRLDTGPTDTMKYYRHIPFFRVDDLHSMVPYDCVPVAVDLIEGAISLHEYRHPERAFYIFGAEDATLGNRILSWCRDIVYVPTDGCMNLAATVNVILYDRQLKANKQFEAGASHCSTAS
jgi:tRNA(Leu) C34 or U34 (ribose-2'-O)-methylase TrmL